MKLLIIEDNDNIKEISKEELKELKDINQIKIIEYCKVKTSPTIEYQLCPKCNGQGITSRPPWVPYDQNEWTSSATSYVCNICHGAGIIPKAIL